MYRRTFLRHLQICSGAVTRNKSFHPRHRRGISSSSPVGIGSLILNARQTNHHQQSRSICGFRRDFLAPPTKLHTSLLLKTRLCFELPSRPAVTLAMANNNLNHTSNNSDVMGESVTIIRYQPGDERFQMQVTLRTGKTFNFSRLCADSLSNVVTRMSTNIGKKVKNFDGTVKFLSAESEGSNLVERGEDPEQVEFDRILKTYFDGPAASLQLQVGEEVYDVVFNPPEVFSAKFFGSCMPTLPLFPYRLETSDHFCKKTSLFKWEFSRGKPSPEVPPKLRKKSKGGSDQIENLKAESEWRECGTSFIFTPEKGMEGGYLRFTCTPSNGKMLGKPFTIMLPHPIGNLPVERFIYEERLSRLIPKLEGGDCLRVLSYNVLADTYATPEWFISSPKESLDAGYRFPILNREIQLYQADLICLQEVDEKFYEGNFEPFLGAQSYKGIFTSKVGNTKEGIATFHNSSKLTLIESYECVILEHMKKLPLWKNLEAVGEEFTQRLEERNTVFHISAFQVNHCPKKTILLVGNVHLYFHPDADHIRLLQTITCINFLQSKIDYVKETYPGRRVAVIYCGDMNCTPPFSSYRLLTTGKVEENDEDWTNHPEEKITPGIAVSHSLNLTNSHPGNELTNITTCFEGCLDYILYQPDCFQLLNTYSPPSKEEIAVLTKTEEVRKVSLPNFYTPSDHLPIMADLKLKS